MEKDKKVILIGAILILLVAAFTFLRPKFDWNSSSDEKKDSASVEKEQYSFISSVDLEKQPDQYAVFDLRSPEEFQQEHLIGSFNVSTDTLDQYLENLPLGQKIVLIGSNSTDFSTKSLAQKLKEKGVENFSILSGGFAAWIESGNRTIRRGNPGSLADQAKINILKPEELKSLLDEKNPRLLILDLRSEKAFFSEHLPQAKNIPADQLEEKFQSIPSGKMLVYYAGSEIETFQAGVALFDLGFLGGSALEGGIEAWKTKGFPLEK